MDKKVVIVGIGMDGAKTLTAEAREAIDGAQLIIGAKRMVEPFLSLGKQLFISYNTEEIADFIRKSDLTDVAVLMSGDCGFYSGAEKLAKLLDTCTVISGISSPVYFFSKLKMPWQDCHYVSLHGADANIVRNVCTYEKTFFLLGGKVTVSEICRKLCCYGLKNLQVYIGENLSAENEKILNGIAADFTDYENANLCVMAVINPDYERVLRSGIADGMFLRGNVPMTKAEVRAVCISKLMIKKDAVCWDIGCGTGSVTVEMALQCADGTVYAVDKNVEAVGLTQQNALKFRCDNIVVQGGRAEQIAAVFPPPDCVFIGGSGGCIDEIISIAAEKNPHANFVVTAVTLETLNKAIAVFERLEIPYEVSQIAVTRTRKIGSSTMLAAENPIFIINGARL